MKVKKKTILGTIIFLVVVTLVVWRQKTVPTESSQSSKSASHPATTTQNSKSLSPAAEQPLSSTSSNVLANAKKKVAEMGVLEEMAMLDEIAKQDLPAIFMAMLDAERVEKDDLKQQHLQTVLSDAMRIKKPTPEFLEQLYGFVINTANSQFERDLLIGALEGAATKESVTLLLRLAKTAPDVKVRESAASLAGLGHPNQNVADLFPILERTWRETSDPILIGSTSTAMAKFGTASGVELLLSAALATDSRDEERQQAAKNALQIVSNGEAVPPLAARLKGQAPTSEVVELLAPILAGTNGPDGQQALVSWLQGRSENATPLVEQLFRQHIRTDPFESAWGKALDPAVPFVNEENRKAIREALDRHRVDRKQEP